MARHYAIVPAAGSGARFGSDVPKQYLTLGGRPMLYHALRVLTAHRAIDRTVVVLSPGDRYWEGFDWSALGDGLSVVREGGATRADSVAAGLRVLSADLEEHDWVLVHDAARPCLDPVDLDALITTLADDGVGGLLAVPLADTLKHGDAGGRVDRTPPRDGLWQAQTPQMFRAGILRDALAGHRHVTDEAGAVEALGFRPRLVASARPNFKVTYASDLELARLIIESRTATETVHV